MFHHKEPNRLSHDQFALYNIECAEMIQIHKYTIPSQQQCRKYSWKKETSKITHGEIINKNEKNFFLSWTSHPINFFSRDDKKEGHNRCLILLEIECHIMSLRRSYLSKVQITKERTSIEKHGGCTIVAKPDRSIHLRAWETMLKKHCPLWSPMTLPLPLFRGASGILSKIPLLFVLSFKFKFFV
jgi:hypothetical protein